MRETEFRAWDKKLNVMWKSISFIKLLRYLFFQSMPNSTAYTEIKSHFDDIVWLEYTGLKDRTGCEIYEGDICVRDYGDGDPLIFKVVFADGRFGEWWKGMEEDGIADGSVIRRNSKIIGNIYENPEFLK